MSLGMNCTTGQWISDIDHIKQSVKKILTTLVGTRLERREFGSLLPELIDSPINNHLLILLYASVATALMLHEPRLRIQQITASIDQTFANPTIEITLTGFIKISDWQESTLTIELNHV